MVWSESKEHLVSNNEILPSLPGASIINITWGLTDLDD